MRSSAMLPIRFFRFSPFQSVMLAASLVAAVAIYGADVDAQSTAPSQNAKAAATLRARPRTHRALKKQAKAPEPVAQTPPPPPMPHWPANDSPTPASVVWDATGLRINASNSSLQQILSEVSTETGTKIEGTIPDQRIYGEFGPGQARDVLSQLLLGSGYNVLLAGDLGKGAPREIVLTPRRASGGVPQTANVNRPQQDSDDDMAEQPEDQPQPPIQPAEPPPLQNNARPSFGPNGPMRTPQQVMEEMQQRQLLQQQQMEQQQQQQQQNPQ